MKNNNNPHEKTVRRAALPEVMHAADVALALGVSPAASETLLQAGRLGPHFEVGGHPAVLRKDFLEALERRAASTGARDVLPGRRSGRDLREAGDE
ncbi:MAG: hypothetical protein GY711_11490 [bacterium]|nr:hypothetical protein [bacterium]